MANMIDIELPDRVDARDGLVAELARSLKSEAENNTPLGKLYGETAAQLLAIHLLRKHCAVRHAPPPLCAGLSRGQLNKVREYIDACLDRDISLETLARLCGLSAWHFARMFKASTGRPPHRYIIERRIERARQLLAHTALPIIHIGLDVGYENHSHFASIFKKAAGCTPREYRNRHQR